MVDVDEGVAAPPSVELFRITGRPEDHPLWEQQVELERGMLREGADKVRDRETVAREKRQMTRLQPVRSLLTDWLPGCAESLKLWLRAMRVQRGPKPISLEPLSQIDPHVACLLALRTILDGITTKRMAVTGLAIEIGRNVEHEMKVRLWEEQDPDSYYSLQDYLERDGATSGHIAKNNIIRVNKLLATADWDVGWVKWHKEMQFRVGVALIDVVVRQTGWFELEDDPEFVWKAGTKKGPKLALVPKQGLIHWLEEAVQHDELRSPALKPTVVPPKPWTSTKGGGYWTPYVRGPRLIRFKASQEQQKERAADEYEAIDMPKVYEAINYLQEVPWRVNGRVLDVAMASFQQDLALAGTVRTQEIDPPPKPADIETNDEARLKWKRDAARIIKKNIRNHADVESLKLKLRVATEYRGFEEIYFPHMCDFRGRMYPIPVGLQPQGDDIARGLLEFADGKAITEENGGVDWLAIHLASCWGNDKWSYADRIEWVRQNEDLWRAIAKDPLGELAWCVMEGPDKVDKPWCALAAVFEWVGYLDHGDGFVSHLPVSVDGTCNGIQHLSAMTLDEVAGAYVNLVPGDLPRDIYKFVAGNLQEVLVRIRDDGGLNADHAAYWLRLTNGELPRSLTKRQVMVLPYGGTKDSFFTYTRAWLDEHDRVPEGLDYRAEEVKLYLKTRTARISFLVLKMWDVVKEVVSGGMVVMEWLQKCAKVAAVGNQPIFWVTPSGFVVRHFYGQQLSKKVDLLLDGQRVQLRLSETTADLDTKSQLQGISPNFVHSLDAAALCLSLVEARRVGLAGFTSVHDAYGTHAADMWALFGILRQAFVDVHKTDMLAEYRGKCAAVFVDHLRAERGDELDPMQAGELAEEQLPRMPGRGRLDLDAVLQSDYFFA